MLLSPSPSFITVKIIKTYNGIIRLDRNGILGFYSKVRDR